MKFRNGFFEKGLGLENEEKASVKQSAIQRKKTKKARRFLNEQYPNIKIKDQRTLKVAKVKKNSYKQNFERKICDFSLKFEKTLPWRRIRLTKKELKWCVHSVGVFATKGGGQSVIFPLFQPTILTSKARETRVFAK